MLRRLAFLLEAVDRVRFGAPTLPGPDAAVPTGEQDCRILVVVAHWRRLDGDAASQIEPLRTCLLGLLALQVDQLDVVIQTNDETGAAAAVAEIVREGGAALSAATVRVGEWARPSAGPKDIVIERWRPRGLRTHGFNLTWDHKRIFRRALRARHFTHLLYLEDDIGFTGANLRYWLAARRPLHANALIPGFVRFEWHEGRRMLTDQARSGQHLDAGTVEVLGLGRVGLSVSRRPYQALVLLDAPLAEHHLARSPMRSRLRSRVIDWPIRERACAGEMFCPTRSPLRAFIAAEVAPRPQSRHGVLLDAAAADGTGFVPGALIEHLRPTASNDPLTTLGKVPVEGF